MRGKETLLLAAAVGLVAWAVYLWRDSRFPIPDLLAAYVARPTPASAKVPAHDSALNHRLRNHSGAGLNTVRKTGFPIESTAVDVPPPPFPTQENLRTGTALAQMKQTYGEPILNVTELKAGHMFERWYYVKFDNTAMTVATLDDGFVSSVKTLSRPDFGVHLGRTGG